MYLIMHVLRPDIRIIIIDNVTEKGFHAKRPATFSFFTLFHSLRVFFLVDGSKQEGVLKWE